MHWFCCSFHPPYTLATLFKTRTLNALPFNWAKLLGVMILEKFNPLKKYYAFFPLTGSHILFGRLNKHTAKWTLEQRICGRIFHIFFLLLFNFSHSQRWGREKTFMWLWLQIDTIKYNALTHCQFEIWKWMNEDGPMDGAENVNEKSRAEMKLLMRGYREKVIFEVIKHWREPIPMGSCVSFCTCPWNTRHSSAWLRHVQY